MKLRVLAIGQKMPAWVKDGVAEYSKRLPAEMPLDWVELPLGQRAKNRPVEQAMAQEGDAMLATIRADDTVVALAVDGKPWSTPDLARQLENWWLEGRDLCLLIGGPDGLDPRCLARADQRWSLSALTLPHPLVRVLLSEQLYRAWTITRNHPYHK